MRDSLRNDLVHGEPLKLQAVPLSFSVATTAPTASHSEEGRLHRDAKGKQRANEADM